MSSNSVYDTAITPSIVMI